MKYEEALSILENNPSEQDVNRVAREWVSEHGYETIRNAAGREIMAFAGYTADDEVPTQYSFKQHAWTKITDAAGEESRFVTAIRVDGLDSAVKDITADGYKILKSKREEKEGKDGSKYSVDIFFVDGDVKEEVLQRYMNRDWYAGSSVLSKGSGYYKNSDEFKITDAAGDGLERAKKAMKGAFASFKSPDKGKWQIRFRPNSNWVNLFLPYEKVFHAFDIVKRGESFAVEESGYAKKLEKSYLPPFFHDLVPLFNDALRGVKVTDSHIDERDLKSLENIINTELGKSEFADKFTVKPVQNGFVLLDKDGSGYGIKVGFTTFGGIVAGAYGPDVEHRNEYFTPNMGVFARNIVNRMGDARVGISTNIRTSPVRAPFRA